MTSTYVNFSNLWLKSLNRKHPIWKNHQVQLPTNQMSKDEIEKKINYKKDPKQKRVIKIMKT
jgi:hypothetical protein